MTTPDAIDRLTRLRELHAMHNGLTALPGASAICTSYATSICATTRSTNYQTQ